MHLWFKRCATTGGGNALCKLTILPIEAITSRTEVERVVCGLIGHRNNVVMDHL